MALFPCLLHFIRSDSTITSLMNHYPGRVSHCPLLLGTVCVVSAAVLLSCLVVSSPGHEPLLFNNAIFVSHEARKLCFLVGVVETCLIKQLLSQICFKFNTSDRVKVPLIFLFNFLSPSSFIPIYSHNCQISWPSN